MTAADGRRLIHASTALALLIPTFGSWSWLRMILLLGLPVVLALEWMRLRRAGVHAALTRVVPVFRGSEATAVSGAVWLWIGFAAAAWFPPPAARGGILAGSLADPAAALAGSRWGRGAAKSWVGTGAACLVAGVSLLASGLAVLPALAGAAAAGGLERWSRPLDDNLMVAPGVAACLWLLS